jgi:hypothetical protein
MSVNLSRPARKCAFTRGTGPGLHLKLPTRTAAVTVGQGSPPGLRRGDRHRFRFKDGPRTENPNIAGKSSFALMLKVLSTSVFALFLYLVLPHSCLPSLCLCLCNHPFLSLYRFLSLPYHPFTHPRFLSSLLHCPYNGD